MTLKIMYTVMIKSISSTRIIPLIIAFAALGCSREIHSKKTDGKGYLNSTAFKEDIKNRNEYINNYVYSTKRMFLLLDEEGFLYEPKYEFFAVYFTANKGVCDFYIFKSIDSLATYSIKTINDGQSIFYVDKSSNDSLDKKSYDINIRSKTKDHNSIISSTELFDEIAIASRLKQEFYPEYDNPIRGLYLFYKNEYHLVTDFKIQAGLMNKIDSFFKNQ